MDIILIKVDGEVVFPTQAPHLNATFYSKIIQEN